MNTPRLFRPMFTLGIIVTFGAVISYLLVPGMRSTPGGILILLVLLSLGITAIVRDLYLLGKEIKAMEEANKKSQGRGPD